MSTHFEEVREYGDGFRGNIGEIGSRVRGGRQEIYEQSDTTWQDFYDRKQDAED